MPNPNDPGFSNEFAVQAGFPSSGEMQQRAGQGGLPPQRQQMPFEHKRAPATNQAVPYVQPVMQGTPAAQGSQYQVRQQQLSPGVASFLRANAIDQGARGVEQRLGQIENQMQGMGSPRDAAVGSMAQMRSGRDAQQPQRAPAAVSQAADMMQAQALGGQLAVSPGQAFDPRTGVAGAGQMARDNIAYQQMVEKLKQEQAAAKFNWMAQKAKEAAASAGYGEAGGSSLSPNREAGKEWLKSAGYEVGGGTPGMQVGALARGGFPTALPPGMQLGALTGGMPIVPQQRVSDVEQMRRGIAPAVAPIQPGVPPVGAQMPDVGMMNAMFPQGFVPTPIEGRRSMQRAPEGAAPKPQKPLFDPGFAVPPGDSSIAEEEIRAEPPELQGAVRAEPPELQRAGGAVAGGVAPGMQLGAMAGPPELLEKEEGETWQTPGGDQPDVHLSNAEVITKDMFDLVDRLGKLGDKITKGMLENAKQQVQKQKDYLHAALSEAGGGILAGGSPLLAQESITAVKALTDAQYQAAKAEVAIANSQANILANLLNQNNKVMLANEALGWAKDKEAKFDKRWQRGQDFKEKSWDEQLAWTKEAHKDNMDFKTEQGEKQWLLAAVDMAAKNGWKLDREGVMELANILGGDVDDETAKAFWDKQAEGGDEAGSIVGDPTESNIYHLESKEFTGSLPKKEQLALDEKLAAQVFEEAEGTFVDEKKIVNLLNNISPAYREYIMTKLKEWSDGDGWKNLVEAMSDEDSTMTDDFNKLMGLGGYKEMYGHTGGFWF